MIRLKTEKEKMISGENTILLILNLFLNEHEQIEYVISIIKGILMR